MTRGRLACLLLLAACGKPETALIGPRVAQPEVRIGVAVGGATVRIGGAAALVVRTGDGAAAGDIPAGAEATLRRVGGAVRLETPGGAIVRDSLHLAAPDPDGFVRVNGRDYRGRLVLLSGRAGLTVVNVVGLESYLAGVVSAEMGRRDSSELAALEAQAVASRTYAVRNLGRWRAEGYDFRATVSDQVYGGVGAETAMGWDAVTATGGMILAWQGAPIDAFFFSTCGGRTAGGTEVFAAADRPYLRSVRDADRSGAAYCRISPRFAWRTEWSAETLRDLLRESLPAVTGEPVPAGAVLRSIQVTERSPSDRVVGLRVEFDHRSLTVRGPAVRQVLRPAPGETLRSAGFVLAERRDGGRLVRLIADGHGAGHAVGLCQWGAVGRARAGHRYAEILQAYYPGTELERFY